MITWTVLLALALNYILMRDRKNIGLLLNQLLQFLSYSVQQYLRKVNSFLMTETLRTMKDAELIRRNI
jgi:hypothetical protein